MPNIATVNGVGYASIGTVNGVAKASISTINSVDFIRMELSGGNSSQTYSSGGVNYKSITFTSSGTLTCTGTNGIIDIMVISGGGGGGNNGLGEGGTHAGAGGAGGMVDKNE